MTFRGKRRNFVQGSEPGPVALEMYKNLTDIQTEQAPDSQGWVVAV